MEKVILTPVLAERDLPRYAVEKGGKVIGYVEGHYPTIEKNIPGKTYVAWRRKSKTLHWIADWNGRRINPYRSLYTSRKKAVEAVVEANM